MSSLPHSIERPDLSLVMPCYNEEALVGYTIPKLFDAFSKAGHQLELVAVDNGSCDRTGERLRALAARYPGRSEERRVGKESRSRWSPYH